MFLEIEGVFVECDNIAASELLEVRAWTIRLQLAAFFSLGGGKRRSASNMNKSFQKGSLVSLAGSTCW